MENDIKYSVVGAFVMGLGAVLVAAVLWLGAGFNRQAYATYLAYVEESVSGLNVKAPVKYRGVEVGYVGSVMLDPNDPQRVRLTLFLHEGTPVKSDTTATLSTQGLTGLAFVDLSGGSPQAPSLSIQEGEEFPVIKTKPSLFALLGTSVSDVLGNISELSKSLNRLADAFADGLEEDGATLKQTLANLESLTRKLDNVLRDENQQALSTSLRNLDQISGALAKNSQTIEAIVNNADKSLANMAQASAVLPATVQRFGVAAGDVSTAADAIVKISTDLDSAIKQGKYGVESFTQQTMPQIQQLLLEMQQLAQSMRRLSQHVERNPSALIFGGNKPVGPGE